MDDCNTKCFLTNCQCQILYIYRCMWKITSSNLMLGICYDPFRQPFPFRNGNFPFRNQYGFKLGPPFRNPYTLSTQMLAWHSLAWCIVIVLQYLHINIHYCSYSFINYSTKETHIWLPWHIILILGIATHNYLVPNCSAINLEYITRNMVKIKQLCLSIGSARYRGVWSQKLHFLIIELLWLRHSYWTTH